MKSNASSPSLGESTNSYSAGWKIHSLSPLGMLRSRIPPAPVLPLGNQAWLGTEFPFPFMHWAFCSLGLQDIPSCGVKL